MIVLFEAQGGHLYEFNCNDFVVSIPDDEEGVSKAYFYDMEGNVHIKPRELNVFKTKLTECFKDSGDSCIFTYDFGDGWEFSLTLEKLFRTKSL